MFQTQIYFTWTDLEANIVDFCRVPKIKNIQEAQIYFT